MARPKKQFTDDQISWVKENIAHCSIADVARHLGIPHETARNHFGELHKKEHLQKKIELQKAMYEKALEGNPTLMIWLSKQWLNMTDDGIVDDEGLVGDVEFGDVDGNI